MLLFFVNSLSLEVLYILEILRLHRQFRTYIFDCKFSRLRCGVDSTFFFLIFFIAKSKEIRSAVEEHGQAVQGSSFVEDVNYSENEIM